MPRAIDYEACSASTDSSAVRRSRGDRADGPPGRCGRAKERCDRCLPCRRAAPAPAARCVSRREDTQNGPRRQRKKVQPVLPFWDRNAIAAAPIAAPPRAERRRQNCPARDRIV